MPWRTTPVWIKVAVVGYYEFSPDPADPTKQLKRKRMTVISEARGMNYASAQALAEASPIAYENGSEAYEAREGAGGNWTVVKTLDYYVGEWVAGGGSP